VNYCCIGSVWSVDVIEGVETIFNLHSNNSNCKAFMDIINFAWSRNFYLLFKLRYKVEFTKNSYVKSVTYFNLINIGTNLLTLASLRTHHVLQGRALFLECCIRPYATMVFRLYQPKPIIFECIWTLIDTWKLSSWCWRIKFASSFI